LVFEPAAAKVRNLAITRDGELLLCGNMPGNRLMVFRIDQQTGDLTAQGDGIEILVRRAFVFWTDHFPTHKDPGNAMFYNPCCSGMLFVVRALLADDFQYQFEAISVPKATADEPVRAACRSRRRRSIWSMVLRPGTDSAKCVSCHTNGTYMTIRPLLSKTLGPPDGANRVFFAEQLQKLQAKPLDRLKQSTRPAQVIYIAAELAEWDASVGGSLSPETETALELMFRIQTEEGTWGTLDCWPPFESDAWHEATVAAMAAAAAPGWIAKVQASPDSPTAAGLEKLRQYLREASHRCTITVEFCCCGLLLECPIC
jgi:hypothetical protein